MIETQNPYHHGDLRRALITTALEIIDTQGVRALTMREVSKRIGVSHNASYRHFQNKRQLLCAVAEHGFRALAEQSEALMVKAGDNALEALVIMGKSYIDFALHNPSLYRLMCGPELTREARPESLQEAAGQAFNLLPATVARCQEQGYFRGGSSLAIGTLLWSQMHGLISLLMDGQLLTDGDEDAFPILLTDHLAKQPKDADKLMDLIVDVMLWGLAPGRGKPGLDSGGLRL